MSILKTNNMRKLTFILLLTIYAMFTIVCVANALMR